MPTQLEPFSIRNQGIYGVIRQAEVDDRLIPEGAVTEANNVQFDRKGAVTERLGLAALGGTVVAGASAIGLYNTQSSTLIAAYVTSGSNAIYSWSGAAWNKSLTLNSGSGVFRFADFAGRVIAVNGFENSIRAWNGSGLDSSSATWDSSGNPINAQNLWYAAGNDNNTNYLRPKFVEVYKSRLYVAGDSVNPDRLFFSKVISTAGNITWAPTTDFVDINPNDGENITALKRYSLELLVFKPNYIYRFRTSATDPDPLIKIGTRSQESVVEGKKGVYFFHDSGIYVYSGGYPVEISRPISDFIAAIPYSQYGSINAWKDGDHIMFFIGNVTITSNVKKAATGDVWTNVVLRYTESSGIWTVYSYNCNPVRGADFNNGTTLTRVVANQKGEVATYDSGNTDLGEPIQYRVITKWYENGGIVNSKFLQQILGVTIQAEEAHLYYQADFENEWHDLGALQDSITYFENKNIQFNVIRFKVEGISSQKPLIFLGIEITKGLNEGITKE